MFQLRQPGAGKLIAMMLLVSVVCSLIYGVVVGTFSGGDATLGRAGQNRGGPDDFGADLPAEPLHFHLLERFAGAAGRSLRAARRAADADDDSAHRLRAGRVDFLAIHRIARLDGHAASDFLVHRDHLRAAIFGDRIFPLERPIARRFPHVGHHLSARGGANDHRAAADSRHGGHLFAEGESNFSGRTGPIA